MPFNIRAFLADIERPLIDGEPTAPDSEERGEKEEKAADMVALVEETTRKIRELTGNAGTPDNPLFRAKPKFQNVDLEKEFDDAEQSSDPTILLNDGYDFLAQGRYADAVEALEAARKISDDDPQTHELLGEAYFGLGEYRKSWKAYGVYLQSVSHDDRARALHAEAAQKHLETLDHDRYSFEVKQLQQDIVNDRAMIVAVNSDKELDELKGLQEKLEKADFKSPEEAKQALDQVQTLAQNYLALSSAPLADSEDSEFVQKRLNLLAGQAYQIAGALSSNSAYEDIKKLTPLYQGYFYLTEGNTDAAAEEFTKVGKDIPEAGQILKSIKDDKLKTINRMALDAWEAIIVESQSEALDGANGIQGQLGSLINELVDDGRSTVSRIHDEATVQRKVIVRVRDLINSGQCTTIRGALDIIKNDDDGGVILRASVKAQQILEHMDGREEEGAGALAHLIQYTSHLQPDEELAAKLLDDADQLSARHNAVQTPFALAALVQATSAKDSLKESAAHQIRSLKEGKNFTDSLWDMIRTTGIDDVVQIATMAAASKVGSLAKLATLDRLAAAGISGTKALVIAGGAEILAEGSTLWGMNVFEEAMHHDAEKVFSAEHLAKSYGATLAMLPFIKVFSAAGERAGIEGARALGWVAEGGRALTGAGEIFAKGTAHIAGATGMIASSLFSQSIGLVPMTPGGLGGTVVHEIFGYMKYAVAGSTLHNAIELSPHEEIGIAVPDVLPEAIEMPAAARQARSVEDDTQPTRLVAMSETGQDFDKLSQQEQAELAVHGIEYVYGFLDGLRRQFKMGEPLSPVEVVDAQVDQNRETVRLSVGKTTEVESLLDDIVAHADNLGGQKVIPLTVRSREPGRLILETPSGRPITVDAVVEEAPASDVRNKIADPGRLYSVGGPAALYASLTGSGVSPGAAAAITGALSLVGFLGMFFVRGLPKSAPLPILEIQPQAGRDFVVGRNPGSDLVLDDSAVSGTHVTFHQEGGVWYAVNGTLGQSKQSLNGFAVEGNWVSGKFAQVKDGDRITIRTSEDGGKGHRTIVFREPEKAAPTMEAAAKISKPSDWTDRKEDWRGIAAASNKGLHYKENNEDRYVVLTAPDGRSLMVAIDGMGGHAGGERAAQLAMIAIRQAMMNGKSAAEALTAADAAITKDNKMLGLTKSPPGAVAMAAELVPQADGTYTATFSGVGDCEAVVIRPGASQPILHHTMRANALSKAVRESGGRPFKTLADGRLARGQTLDLRMDPFANRVDSALGGHDAKIDVSVPEKPLRDGDIVLVGSDGLFENFGRLDVIQEVIRLNGSRTAAEIRDALMTESLIRMSLAENAFDKVLSHREYVEAYREATGQEPPQNWRGMYEPWKDASGQYRAYSLDKNGNLTESGSGRTIDHFKNDNVTLAVQVVGQPVHRTQ